MSILPFDRMSTLPIYRTCKVVRFYEYQDTPNTLAGLPRDYPVGTPVYIVRRGTADPDKYLVETEDGYLAWVWMDYQLEMIPSGLPD